MSMPVRYRGLSKYSYVVLTSIRERLQERTALVGRLAFLAILLLIFSRLWIAIGKSSSLGGLGGRREADFVWYLAVTEWVLLSVPSIHLEVEDDIRTGRIAYLLPQPISYLGLKLAKGWGEMLVRLATLGPAAFFLARGLSGVGPPSARALVCAIPFGLAASTVLLVCQTAIGLSAFWLHDANPAYLVWQKLAFVCGGLLVPLDLYPRWLAKIASYTPFPTLLYGPARFALGEGDHVLSLSLHLAAWALVVGIIVWGVYARSVRSLEIGGG